MKNNREKKIIFINFINICYVYIINNQVCQVVEKQLVKNDKVHGGV